MTPCQRPPERFLVSSRLLLPRTRLLPAPPGRDQCQSNWIQSLCMVTVRTATTGYMVRHPACASPERRRYRKKGNESQEHTAGSTRHQPPDGHGAHPPAPCPSKGGKLHHGDTGAQRTLNVFNEMSLCPCVSMVKLSRTMRQKERRIMRAPVMARTRAMAVRAASVFLVARPRADGAFARTREKTNGGTARRHNQTLKAQHFWRPPASRPAALPGRLGQHGGVAFLAMPRGDDPRASGHRRLFQEIPQPVAIIGIA